jgi:spore germination protein GerM
MSRSDDRRMKELADRLVAMSPEPPPFPEEVSVTQREDSKPRPALVFAGAALVVLLLAAIPIFLSRGGGEVDPIASSTTSTVPTTVTTVPEATTTASLAPTTTAPPVTTTQPAPTTTEVAGEPRGVVVFLTEAPENSFLGNPALVPFLVGAFATDEELDDTETALSLLTMDELFLPEGFESSIPDPVEVVSVTRADQIVTVDMNEPFLDGAGGLLADMTMLNQLIFTAGEGEEISEVLFTVGGQPVTAFGSEGLDLSQPVGRDAFLDQLNSVNLDSALSGSGASPLAVTGFANVFEATVSLEVLDAGGTVVHEDFTTATCGTGCWGAFSFSVAYPFSGGETVRVFWHSAEDGSPSDVVSVPVAWGDDQVWDLISNPGTP